MTAIRQSIADHAVSVLKSRRLRSIMWGERSLVEIAVNAGVKTQQSSSAMAAVLDALARSPHLFEPMPLFRRDTKGLRRLRRGFWLRDDRILITAEVFASFPREVCPACSGTQSQDIDTRRYAGQRTRVQSYGQGYLAEVYSASETHASYVISSDGSDGPSVTLSTWTAGRSTHYFDPVPFVTEDPNERWCVCGDRAVPF